MRNLPLLCTTLTALIAYATSACATSSSEETVTGSDEVVAGNDELVVGSVVCTPKDPCEHDGDGEIGACVETIELEPVAGGNVRAVIRQRTRAGAPGPLVTLVSERPTIPTDGRIAARFESGEYWIDVVKVGDHYEGEMTLKQDFLYQVTCQPVEAQGSCSVGDKVYAVGEMFLVFDGCDT